MEIFGDWLLKNKSINHDQYAEMPHSDRQKLLCEWRRENLLKKVRDKTVTEKDIKNYSECMTILANAMVSDIISGSELDDSAVDGGKEEGSTGPRVDMNDLRDGLQNGLFKPGVYLLSEKIDELICHANSAGCLIVKDMNTGKEFTVGSCKPTQSGHVVLMAGENYPTQCDERKSKLGLVTLSEVINDLSLSSTVCVRDSNCLGDMEPLFLGAVKEFRSSAINEFADSMLVKALYRGYESVKVILY